RDVVRSARPGGWVGPLAGRPGQQGSGLAKEIGQAGVAWLRTRNAAAIGLETMPRTMDNIGFYSGLGFLPNHLTITLTLDAMAAERAPDLLSALPAREERVVIET